MYYGQRIGALILSAGLFFTQLHAHSQKSGPLSYLSLVENPTIHTPSHRVNAYSSFDLSFDLHQGHQRVRLALEPNHDILPAGASVQYLDANGEVDRTETIDRNEHKVFKGDAWLADDAAGNAWTNIGWARVVIRRDGVKPLFEGAFTLMHDHHHVKMRSSYMQSKHELDPEAEDSDDEYMVMFRDSDIERVDTSLQQPLKRSTKPELSCGAGDLHFNTRSDHPIYSNPMLKREVGFWGSMSTRSLFGKRQIDTNGIPSGGNSGGVNLKSTIGKPAGCPSTRRVALFGVATDCSYTGSFNSSDSARQNVITQINTASNLYEKTFNISLGLQNITVSPKDCPGQPQQATPWNTACSDSTTIQDRLNTFSQWRGTRGDDNAYWTLLTTCNTGSAVGLSWLGQLCNNKVDNSTDTNGSSEMVSGANVVAKTNTEWAVIAHETGHTFGAVHDCTSQTCSDGNTVNAQQCCPLSADTCDAGEKYIMNPSTGDGITAFSPCTLGNICSAMGRKSVNTDCLSANKGVTTITGNQCGNGIVEDGEDCDCGGEESCQGNSCCNPKTCKFQNNAVCDDSNEDCCSGCQFAPSSKVCRASTGSCDPEEKCSGNDAVCPQDKTAPNGQDCGNSTAGLACASGQCTSRDLQCKTLMGSFTQKNDTYACDSSNCQLSCASPEFGTGVCYGMQQNFLDGTTCGGGGTCQNGQCSGSSNLKEIGSWISRHKTLVIAIASAIGGLLLLSILICIWRCCARRRRGPLPPGARARRNKPPPSPWGPPPPPIPQGWGQSPMRQGPPSWGGGSPPPLPGGPPGPAGWPQQGYPSPPPLAHRQPT
ncbi:MAG: Fructose-bisphosphate aldolase 1, partial [Chaenotheca gracillima]